MTRRSSTIAAVAELLARVRTRAPAARRDLVARSATGVRRLTDPFARFLAQSVADELTRRQLEMPTALQALALWDSARFVLENIPLHLGKTHYELRRDAILAAPDGLFLEFGVWKGNWLRQMASIRNVHFFGFDSFEGLPQAWSISPPGTFDLGGRPPAMPGNVTLVKGWFVDTLPGFLAEHPGPAAFMHIDCDLYSSTKTVLELVAPRLVPGTQIVLDDFMYTPGWQRQENQAFFEFAATHGWKFEYTGYSSEFPACSAAVRLTARR